MIMSDLRRDTFRSMISRLDADSVDDIRSLLNDATGEMHDAFAGDGVASDDVHIGVYAQLRYENQEHTSEVRVDNGDLTEVGIEGLIERFHTQYEAEYTYRLDAAIDFVGLHLVATADVGKPNVIEQELGSDDATPAHKGSREVDFATDGTHTADLYDGAALTPGMTFDGPAIVEGQGTSVVVHPGCRALLDGFGNLRITI